MSKKKVSVVAGEDAAPEAMETSVELLDRMDLGIDWIWPVAGITAKAN
jgi:hypothetical protein